MLILLVTPWLQLVTKKKIKKCQQSPQTMTSEDKSTIFDNPATIFKQINRTPVQSYLIINIST
jgi:hypothetical protein